MKMKDKSSLHFDTNESIKGTALILLSYISVSVGFSTMSIMRE